MEGAGLLYLGVLVGAFYLLIIRPQMQRNRQMRELMASLEVGDRVVTIGGLHGTIVDIDGAVATIRVADGVELHYEKSAIARKDAPAGEDPESGRDDRASATEDPESPS